MINVINYLLVLGAVLRLVHWHNCRVSLVVDNNEQGASALLSDICEVTVVSSVQSISRTPNIWRGKISVTNKLEGQGFVFPGFSFGCDKPDRLFGDIYRRFGNKYEDGGHRVCFGRILEVLDDVDASTIPLYMLSSTSMDLRLQTRHSQSGEFWQYMKGLEKNVLLFRQNALITRCSVYLSDAVPACANTKLSSQNWTENVMSDISNIQEVEEEMLFGVKHLHLALMADNGSSSTIKAVLMTDTSAINSEIFRFSRICQSSEVPSSVTLDVERFVNNLPMLTDMKFDEMNRELAAELEKLLENRITKDKRTDVEVQELLELLGPVHANVVKNFLKDCPTLISCQATNKENSLSCDLDIEPADWPERLALQCKENQKRALRRFQSSDSVALSSPFHPEDAPSVVDAADFLRCFQPDGNGILDKMSPIRPHPNCRLKRVSSQSDASLKWPDCKNLQYHDVYYNRDRKDEQHAKHMDKIRDKLQRSETLGLYSLGNKISSDLGKRRCRMTSPVRKTSKTRTSLIAAEANISKQESEPAAILRRSPRKKPSARYHDDDELPAALPRPLKRKRSPDDSINRTAPIAIQELSTQALSQAAIDKQKRSERHRQKLQEIVSEVLVASGVDKNDALYESSANKLFQVTKFFVKGLPNSRNLRQEMKNIAEGQVTQVVTLEKRRLQMKQSKK